MGTLQQRSRQRGAAAVFAGVAMVALLAAIALIIDIGNLYFAKRDLQNDVNLAALDAARIVSRCTGATAPDGQAMLDAAEASLLRNGAASTSLLPTVVSGIVSTDAADGSRTLEASASPDEAEAVRVSLSRPMPERIFPQPGAPQDAMLRASATAQQPALGSFFLSTTLASIDGGLINQTLGALLCAPGDSACRQDVVALDAASSTSGLIDTGVSLGQIGLAAGLQVADLADPLALQTATPLLDDFLNNLAGEIAAGAGAGVSQLIRDLGDAAAGNNEPIALGALFDTVDDTAADAPVVNLFELLTAMGQATKPNGTVVPITLPASVLPLNVAEAHAFLRINEPPQFSGMGRPGLAEARSAAVSINLRLQLDPLQDILSGLSGSGTQPIRLGIDIDLANSVARLDQLKCPRNGTNEGQPIAELSAQPAIAAITLGTFSGDPATAPPIATGPSQLVGVELNLVVGSVNVNLFVDAPITTTAGSSNFQPLNAPVTVFDVLQPASTSAGGKATTWKALRPVTPGNPQTVASTDNLQGALGTLFADLNISATSSAGGSTEVCVLFICLPIGDIVDPILDGVTGVIGPLLTGVGGVGDALLDPLLSILGVEVGSATVTMHTVSTSQPHLVSTEMAASDFEDE